MEREQLDLLTNIINRSQDMCPLCKELFDQITWDLMQEFERTLGKRKRETVTRSKS